MADFVEQLTKKGTRQDGPGKLAFEHGSFLLCLALQILRRESQARIRVGASPDKLRTVKPEDLGDVRKLKLPGHPAKLRCHTAGLAAAQTHQAAAIFQRPTARDLPARKPHGNKLCEHQHGHAAARAVERRNGSAFRSDAQGGETDDCVCGAWHLLLLGIGQVAGHRMLLPQFGGGRADFLQKLLLAGEVSGMVLRKAGGDLAVEVAAV